ncbi:MAG: hypothetical protein ACREKQ_13305 [Candidatus Rokuibacteriota bacterium]
MPALRLVTVAMVVLGLSGCAAPLRPFTDPEQARIDEYERAARYILHSRGIAGKPPVVRVGSEPPLSSLARPAAYYTARAGFGDLGRPGRIMINRAVLADDYVAQAVLSHQLSHFVLGHGDGRCGNRRHECEVEAHIASVELLMTGWDLDYSEAVHLQHAYLKSVVLAVRREEAGPAGEPGDACRELEEFADRFKISATCE